MMHGNIPEPPIRPKINSEFRERLRAGPIWLSALVLWAVIMFFRREAAVGVEVGPSRLRFVGPWIARETSLDDVEIIRVTSVETAYGTTTHLTLQTSGGRRRFRLGREDSCAAVLHEVCPNAVYIDSNCVEHLPSETRQPLRVLANLARERGRDGRRLVFWGGILTLWSGGVLGLGLAAFLAGKGWGLPLWPTYIMSFFLVGGLLVIRAGIHQLRRARQLAHHQRWAIAHGIVDEP